MAAGPAAADCASPHEMKDPHLPWQRHQRHIAYANNTRASVEWLGHFEYLLTPPFLGFGGRSKRTPSRKQLGHCAGNCELRQCRLWTIQTVLWKETHTMRLRVLWVLPSHVPLIRCMRIEVNIGHG